MCCTAEDDQEGVMDNLLEALKTGSAFNVNRERKEGRRRAPRAAGGLTMLLSSRRLQWNAYMNLMIELTESVF